MQVKWANGKIGKSTKRFRGQRSCTICPNCLVFPSEVCAVPAMHIFFFSFLPQAIHKPQLILDSVTKINSNI